MALTIEEVMFKKYLTLILTILVINLSLSASVFADTKIEKEIKFAEKVKFNIAKLGTGTDAKVEVKLKDGTKLKGYISQINDDNFVVKDANSGAETTVPYPQTKQIKGNNLSTGATIAIAVGIIVAVGFILGACCAQ